MTKQRTIPALFFNYAQTQLNFHKVNNSFCRVLELVRENSGLFRVTGKSHVITQVGPDIDSYNS
jgi:hypothetical protein